MLKHIEWLITGGAAGNQHRDLLMAISGSAIIANVRAINMYVGAQSISAKRRRILAKKIDLLKHGIKLFSSIGI